MTDLVFEPSKTTHWKNLFPNKMMLLGSQNLNVGEELIARIASIGIEEIKSNSGAAESVPVIKFDNAPPMVLNITNSRTIANLYGERYDDWLGKSIQIYATLIRAFGVDQMALRVREAIPDTAQDVGAFEESLKACTTLTDLKQVFMAVPKHLKPRLAHTKDKMKESLQ